MRETWVCNPPTPCKITLRVAHTPALPLFGNIFPFLTYRQYQRALTLTLLLIWVARSLPPYPLKTEYSTDKLTNKSLFSPARLKTSWLHLKRPLSQFPSEDYPLGCLTGSGSKTTLSKHSPLPCKTLTYHGSGHMALIQLIGPRLSRGQLCPNRFLVNTFPPSSGNVFSEVYWCLYP